MLIKANNNIITMERGDSGSFTVTLNKGSTIDPEIIELRDLDKIYFGVMEPNFPFEAGIIRKMYTIDDLNPDGSITIKLRPEDTEYLHPGIYYYSIKVQLYNGETLAGDVYTIIPKRKFIIVG